MRPLCIYHGNCADGFTAAFVVRKALGGEVDFHAGVYQEPPPDVSGRDVFLVDFSYKRPVLEQMGAAARSVLILDHHKTAAEDLSGFPRPPDWYTAGGMTYPGIAALFDMERSGARITWDYFFPGKTPPRLIAHVEDRDLWRFRLPKTREIQANIFSYPYDFAVWDELVARLENLETWKTFAIEGEAIERKHFKDVKELTGIVTRMMRIGSYVVPVANLPYTLTSDAGHALAKGRGTDESPEFPFAGCYWDTPEGRVFSLRSAKGGVDVADIAKQYGGGGHEKASGFRVAMHELADRRLA